MKGMFNMKRVLPLLLVLALTLSLSSCGGSGGGQAQEPVAGGEQSDTNTPTDTQEPADDQEPADTQEEQESAGGTLVAYFSWSGNTRQVAQIIAQETGGTLFEIEPAQPYTDDYDALLDIAQREQAEGARPELASQVEDWDSYDTVFLGYPNWWSDAPMALYTFLESHDFTGKTLIPFNTSSSGGFGRSLSGIEESASGAQILEGLALTSGELEDAQSLVSQWLDGLGLN